MHLTSKNFRTNLLSFRTLFEYLYEVLTEVTEHAYVGNILANVLWLSSIYHHL